MEKTEMGTKNDPGVFDCYAAALPDEPMFVMLARDPNFQYHVQDWATRRQLAVFCGDRPMTDIEMVDEAYGCAVKGSNWRRENNGIWRRSPVMKSEEG